jgi:hypothetical protein
MREKSGLAFRRQSLWLPPYMQRLEFMNFMGFDDASTRIPSIMLHRYNDDLGTLDDIMA